MAGVGADSKKLQVINGIDAFVYFDISNDFYTPLMQRQFPSKCNTNGLVLMDNIYAIQFATTQLEYPIFSISDFKPLFYSSTKNLNAGVIQFIANVVDIFGHLELNRVSDSHIYFVPRIVIQLFDYKYFLELMNVYVTFPSFTLIPDQQPVVFVSRFFADNVLVITNQAAVIEQQQQSVIKQSTEKVFAPDTLTSTAQLTPIKFTSKALDKYTYITNDGTKYTVGDNGMTLTTNFKNKAQNSIVKARVQKIIDGDTIVVDIVKISSSNPTGYEVIQPDVTIRFVGVDTLELDQSKNPFSDPKKKTQYSDYAKRAKQFVESLMPVGSYIDVLKDTSAGNNGIDEYGRTLAYVWYQAGSSDNKAVDMMINYVLVRNGYALVLPEVLGTNGLYFDKDMHTLFIQARNVAQGKSPDGRQTNVYPKLGIWTVFDLDANGNLK